MADTVTMPKLGFDMAEGTLVRWVKGEGDQVNKGEVLAEIETDKATVEVESTYQGVLFKHLVEAGAVVPVGTPIAVVSAPGEQPDLAQFTGADVQEGEEAGASEQEPERPLPGEPEPSDVQKTEEPQAADAELKATTSDEAQPKETTPVEAQPKAPPMAGEEGDGRLKVSPVARRMAQDQNLDLNQVSGSGPGGRIVRKDIEAAVQQASQKPTPTGAPASPTAAPAGREVALPLPAWGGETAQRPDETIELTKLRAIIGKRMLESNQSVPDFSVTYEYRVDKLMRLRSEINAVLPPDQKLSVNDFLIKAVAYTLLEYPNLNASLKDNQIVRHGGVNIGVAVAVPDGLLTVVCKDADRKPLRMISREVGEMVDKARAGKVRPADIEGSTFSISNLGMFGVDAFTAIINPPESAILAVGAVRDVPVIEEGQVVAGKTMKLTISADHRVTDGAEAAQFMQALADYLEEPLRLVA